MRKLPDAVSANSQQRETGEPGCPDCNYQETGLLQSEFFIQDIEFGQLDFTISCRNFSLCDSPIFFGSIGELCLLQYWIEGNGEELLLQ